MSTNTYNTYDDSFTSSTTDTAGAMTHEEAVSASYEEAQQNMAFTSQTRSYENDNTPTAIDAPIFSSYGGANDSIGFNQVTANSTVKVAGIETSVQAAIAAGLLNPDGTAVTGAHESASSETEADPTPVETAEQPVFDEEAQTTLEAIEVYSPQVIDDVIAALTGTGDELDGAPMDALEVVLGDSAMDAVNEVIYQAEMAFDSYFGSEAESLKEICSEFSHTPMVQQAMQMAAKGDMSGFVSVQNAIRS